MKEFYMDPMLKENFDSVKPHVHKNWDMCFIVSGVEGAGKSTFAFQIAHYLSDGKFDLEHICMSPQDFMEKITRKDFLMPGDALVLDEGFMINSRASMTTLNREFLGILAECRQKQLFLIIICPNYFDLDKNISLWRSKGLFFIDHANMKRGYFKFWNTHKKKLLYLKGKQFYNYNVVKHSFRGTFPKFMPVDEVAYKKIKMEAFQTRSKTSPTESRYRDERSILIYYLRELGISWVEMSKFIKKEGKEVTSDALRMTYDRYTTKRFEKNASLNQHNNKWEREKDNIDELEREGE